MKMLATLTLLGLTLTGCATGSNEAFVDTGSFGIGYSTHEHQGLPLKAWYPSDEATQDITYDVPLKFVGFEGMPVDIPGSATLNAAPAEGSFPVVVLSHGFSLNAEWYSPLAEHLASHGFVVLAPEHTEGDWVGDLVAASVARPLDVSATLDFAEQGPLAASSDMDHVAVVGHSYGGYTALASAGAQFDTAALQTRCDAVDDPQVVGMFCAPLLDGQQELATSMGLDAPPTGLWPSMRDERVQAIVPIAGDAYLFGDEGLASIDIPTLFIGGTDDTGTPWTWGTQQGFDNVSSDTSYLVGLEGGEHMLPAVGCDGMTWTDALPEAYRSYFCSDPVWDKSEAHDVIHHVTTAFLLEVFDNDRTAKKSLDPDLYDEQNLRFERR